MGDAADAAISGACCSWCGIFFVHEHGFPVLCRGCWQDSKPFERAQLVRATEREA